MIAVVTVLQAQRLREDVTMVLFAQQVALIARTAEDLDDKLAGLLDVIARSARTQPRSLMNDPAALRYGSEERAVLSNAHPDLDLARLTREWARFDSRTIALHD